MNVLPVAQVQEIAGDVMQYFAPEYARQFSVCTVNTKLEESMEKPGPEWKLQSPPPASEWLHEGMINKMTARGKWAKNWMVLKNEADRFQCAYFPAEKDKNDMKKAHGEIFLNGYEVREFDADEKKTHGSPGLSLRPRYSERRTWYFKFAATETEEMAKWKEVLRFAVRKAPRPMNPDPVLEASFLAAYRKCWWHFPGWCGPYPGQGGSEKEHLSGMIVDRCNNDVMGDVYANLPSVGPLKSMAKKKVKGLLDETVGAAVGAGWGAASKSIDEAKPKVYAAVEEKMGPLGEANNEMEKKLKDGTQSIIGPILEKHAGPVVGPVCERLVDPVVATMNKLLALWVEKMSAATTVDNAKELSRRATYTSLMGDVWQIIRDFVRGDVMEQLHKNLPGDFNTWRIEDAMEDSSTTLLKNAAFTFETLHKENGGDANAAFASTTEMMTHDCRLDCKIRIMEIMQAIVWEPFSKEVAPAVTDVTAPVADAVPEPLKDFIDVDARLEMVMQNMLNSFVSGIVTPMVEPKAATIENPGTPQAGGAASPPAGGDA